MKSAFLDFQIAKHREFLEQDFYKVESRQPQFKVLFQGVDEIKNTLPAGAKLLILERAYFYGNTSLFAPLFPDFDVEVFDCTLGIGPEDPRYGKQAAWLADERVLRVPVTERVKGTAFPTHYESSFDAVFVPNVTHHERDQYGFFREIAQVLKKGGELYIFEGLVRELHHLPDDYVRYTPMGLEVMLESHQIKVYDVKYGSGVFDVIAYVWQQALDFLPVPEREKYSDWFWSSHFGELQRLDNLYGENVVNPSKGFPMSYFISSRR